MSFFPPLLTTKTVTKSIDARIQVNVIYTNFEKAFDKVFYSLVIIKKNLLNLGFSDDLTRLFSS